MTKLKIGDEVNIVSGKWSGYKGPIVYAGGCGCTVMIEVNKGSYLQVWVLWSLLGDLVIRTE